MDQKEPQTSGDSTSHGNPPARMEDGEGPRPHHRRTCSEGVEEAMNLETKFDDNYTRVMEETNYATLNCFESMLVVQQTLGAQLRESQLKSRLKDSRIQALQHDLRRKESQLEKTTSVTEQHQTHSTQAAQELGERGTATEQLRSDVWRMNHQNQQIEADLENRTADIQRLRATLQSLEDKCQSGEMAIGELQETVDQLRLVDQERYANVQTLFNKTQEQEDEIRERDDEVRRLNTNLDEAKEELREQQHDIGIFQDILDRNEETIKEQQCIIDEHISSKEKQDAVVQHLQTTSQQMEDQVQKQIAKNQQVEASLRESNEQIVKLRANNQTAEKNRQQEQSRISKMQGDLVRKDATIRQLEAVSQQARADLKDGKAIILQLQANCHQAEMDIKSRDATIAQLRESRRGNKKIREEQDVVIKKQQRDINQSKTTIKTLKDDLRNRVGTIKSLQSDIKERNFTIKSLLADQEESTRMMSAVTLAFSLKDATNEQLKADNETLKEYIRLREASASNSEQEVIRTKNVECNSQRLGLLGFLEIIKFTANQLRRRLKELPETETTGCAATKEPLGTPGASSSTHGAVIDNPETPKNSGPKQQERVEGTENYIPAHSDSVNTAEQVGAVPPEPQHAPASASTLAMMTPEIERPQETAEAAQTLLGLGLVGVETWGVSWESYPQLPDDNIEDDDSESKIRATEDGKCVPQIMTPSTIYGRLSCSRTRIFPFSLRLLIYLGRTNLAEVAVSHDPRLAHFIIALPSLPPVYF